MSNLLQEAEACALKIGLHRNSRVPIEVRDDCLSAEDIIRRLIARVRELEETAVELKMDSANYYGKCGVCGTRNCDMLTDTYCASCRIDELEAENQRLREQLCFTGGRGCRTKDAVDEFYGPWAAVCTPSGMVVETTPIAPSIQRAIMERLNQQEETTDG